MVTLSRRDFFAAAGARSIGALVGTAWGASQAVDPVTSVDNPIKSYPDRDWEQVYHDIYAYDEVDWTVCHPNWTQSCALNFYMKNGVPIRADWIAEREDELESVTAAYGFDYSPYGDTLFDEDKRADADEGGSDPDIPETF